jgi:hypothetical protein
MAVYKVKLVSQKNSIVLIVVLLFLFFCSTKVIPTGLPDLIIVFLILVDGIIAYFMWQFIVTGRTEWEIDDDIIRIRWVKPFLMSGRNADDIIDWSDIENISRGPDPNYYTLIILLSNGQKIRFFHSSLTTRDDFGKMMEFMDRHMEILKKERPENKSSV